MLVLTRKIGEAIQIGEEVTIEVLEVHAGRVRLGISAPRTIGVHRSELLVTEKPVLSLCLPMLPVPSIQRNSVAVPAGT